jgi:uncharacterized RDD family membrane protein YckC
MNAAMDDATVAPPAGFWRRAIAFGLDLVLLGLAFMVIGWFAFDALAALGGWEPAIGLVIAGTYFTLLDGTPGSGRTLGKRAMAIRVVDTHGAVLTPMRAAARFAVLGVPYFALDMPIPPLMQGPLAGILFATVYLLAADRPARRGLHDRATGAFVVREAAGAPASRSLATLHRGIAGAIVVLLAAAPLVMPAFIAESRVADLESARRELARDPDVVQASLRLVRHTSGGKETRYVAADVRTRKPVDIDAFSRRCAATIIAHVDEPDYDDSILCRFHYGYDIGIASAWKHAARRYDAKTGESLDHHE